MPVPELPVHEYGHMLSPEEEIRAYAVGLLGFLNPDHLSPPPARDAVLPEDFDHRHFRSPIAGGTNGRHATPALFRSQNIRHKSASRG